MKAIILKVSGLTLSLIFSFIFYAQGNALNIGDKCPDFEFTDMINYAAPKARLSDFRGKLVILDFWSVNCAPCIAAMPKMDSLQKKYQGKIQIIPINPLKFIDSKTKAAIDSFWKNSKAIKKTDLFTSIDTTIGNYFPREGVPHVVWIDGNSTVRAITTAQYVTGSNIEKILDGKVINWPVNRMSQDFDYSIPLLSYTNQTDDNYTPYYTSLSKHIPGVKKQSGFVVDSVRQCVRYYIYNLHILPLYRTTLENTEFRFGNNSRIILEVKDSSKYFYNKNKEYLEDWEARSYFCYEAIMPINTSLEQVQDILHKDLNKFLNINAGIEKRWMDCFVLIQKDKSKTAKILSTDRNKSNHTRFVKWFNDQWEYPPLIDESGLDDDNNLNRIIIKSESNVDISSLRKQLNNVGLDIVPVRREMEVFVITDFQ